MAGGEAVAESVDGLVDELIAEAGRESLGVRDVPGCRVVTRDPRDARSWARWLSCCRCRAVGSMPSAFIASIRHTSGPTIASSNPMSVNVVKDWNLCASTTQPTRSHTLTYGTREDQPLETLPQKLPGSVCRQVSPSK